MLSNIFAPLDAPQIAAPKPLQKAAVPRLDWLSEQLLEELRDAGLCSTWNLLNAVADAQCPRDRTEGRLLRRELWDRLKGLRRMGLAFSIGRNRITANKSDIKKQRHDAWTRRSTVTKARTLRPVSGVKSLTPPELSCQDSPTQNQGGGVIPHANTAIRELAKTETAPDAARITAAATSLAREPRNQPRRWTGWLHGQHCWRGRLIVLPDGEIAPLLWTCRKRVLLRNHLDKEFRDWAVWARRWEEDVRLYKNPEAVRLGSLKKGVKERPSALKKAAARANGKLPPRPGSRPRGRPRKTS